MSDEALAPEASQQAAELILQDERLTSELEDPAADILLPWLLARAQQIVAARLADGRPVDRDAVAAALGPLRGAARAINSLVADHAGLSQCELLTRLLALVDAACSPAPKAPAGCGAAPNGASAAASPPSSTGGIGHA